MKSVEDINLFKVEEDHFGDSRKRGTSRWILHHIFHGHNLVYILIWLIFQTIPTLFVSLLRIQVGKSVNNFIAGNFGNIAINLLLIFVYGVLGPIISLIANFAREMIAQNMERDVRREFYTNMLMKSQSFHDSQRVGDIMARATQDVRMLNYLINPAISVLMESVLIFIVPLFVISVTYPPQMLVSPVVYLVVFLISTIRYVRKVSPVTKEQQRAFGELNSTITEQISGIEVIKSTSYEEEAQRKYDKLAQERRDLNIQVAKYEAKSFAFYFISIMIIVAFSHSIYMYYNGSMNIGEIVAYISIVSTYKEGANFSVWAFSIVSRAEAGANRLLDLMKKKASIQNLKDPLGECIEGTIEFKNVTFVYPGSNAIVLRDISFILKTGETLAIVGMTGSGKTTLTKLISRLYDIEKGDILIDGTNVQKYELNNLRNQISYIEQDIFLFSDSIKENISLGRNYSDEELHKAAKMAQAHDFIMKLPEKYNSEIGERGVQLSGGEKQRIAIARAFLSDPKILVLDDSTSAIDSETEERIQSAISEILKDRTTILITHRLSQVRWADKIIVMDKGQIVAQGSHEHLLKTSEKYRNIFVTRFDKKAEELMEADA